MTITKEQFIEAYLNHPAQGWVRWAFKYFSKSTEKENMKLSRTIVWILGSLFLVGFFATVVNLPRPIIATVTIAYCIGLAILVLFLFAAVQVNNFRIRRIAKELGVTLAEYNKLADEYFD